MAEVEGVEGSRLARTRCVYIRRPAPVWFMQTPDKPDIQIGTSAATHQNTPGGGVETRTAQAWGLILERKTCVVSHLYYV